MSTEATPSPQPFTYAAFINEIEELIEEATRLEQDERRDGNPSFYRWRQRLEGLLTRVRRTYMDVNCGIAERVFYALGYGANSADDRYAFDRAMSDTLIELELLVENYKKFGSPSSKEKPARQQLVASQDKKADELPLPAEQEVTWPWLRKHVPAKLWLTAAGLQLTLLAGVISVSAGFGAWMQRHDIYPFDQQKAQAAAPSFSIENAQPSNNKGGIILLDQPPQTKSNAAGTPKIKATTGATKADDRPIIVYDTSGDSKLTAPASKPKDGMVILDDSAKPRK